MVTCSGVFSWLSVEAHSFVTCTAVICLKQQVHILVFLKLVNFMSSMVPVLYFFPLLECVSINTCQVISHVIFLVSNSMVMFITVWVLVFYPPVEHSKNYHKDYTRLCIAHGSAPYQSIGIHSPWLYLM